MSTIHFESKPYKIGSWTVIWLPPEESAKLPSRGQVVVKGAVNDYKFHTPIEPDGNGSHWLHVDKDMQKGAHAKAGEPVTVDIEPTKEWPEPVIPADWQAALDYDAKVEALWNDITPMSRWEWLRWIGSTKEPATRAKRIEVSCSKLLKGWRRPCCFNRNMCCVPDVSKSGVLLGSDGVSLAAK